MFRSSQTTSKYRISYARGLSCCLSGCPGIRAVNKDFPNPNFDVKVVCSVLCSFSYLLKILKKICNVRISCSCIDTKDTYEAEWYCHFIWFGVEKEAHIFLSFHWK